MVTIPLENYTHKKLVPIIILEQRVYESIMRCALAIQMARETNRYCAVKKHMIM